MMRTTIPVIALIAWCAGCGGAGHEREARATYNDGLRALEARDWETAQNKLLEARDEAGPDPELRFRAAFNLGLAFAGQADQVAGEDPAKAVQLLSESASWFRDAQRVAPKDKDAPVNFELVLRRRQQLEDQLNKDKDRLEARLAAVIEEQRGVRDQVRTLMQAVAEAGAGAEPVAFTDQFDQLATSERMVLAEAGAILDLAGDERHVLEQKPEAERSQEDAMRIAQLTNLEHYVERGRSALGDASRALRKLSGERAHDRGDAAITELKRALEQLLDPATVLKGIAGDQQLLAAHTQAFEKLSGGEITLDDGNKLSRPPWLTAAQLALRQRELDERTGEIAARLAAGVEHAGKGETAGDPATKALLEAAGAALPFVKTAGEAMRAAATSLGASQAAAALEKQRAALEALAQALERFAGTRQVIELAYAEQQQIVALLTPPADGKNEQQPPLSTEERARLLREAIARNVDRLRRLEGLFEAEVAQIDAQAAQAAQAAQGQGGAAPPAEQVEQKQLYQAAEPIRARAQAALEALAARPARPTAEQGQKEIEELRRLFFSVVEHLQELLRAQIDTRDGTASAAAADEEAKAQKIGPLADAQAAHAQKGGEIAGALEQQADAAGQQAGAAAPQPGQPSPQEMAQKLAEAAAEVRSAIEQMSAAATNLGEARDGIGTVAVDLSPALAQQPKAIEHLENALRLLQPPKPQDQDQKDQNQEQQNQGDQDQEQQQQEQKDQMSPQEAQRALQDLRDREAERQKKRQSEAKREPVEKDW